MQLQSNHELRSQPDYDEARRLEVAVTARGHVEKLADPQTIWQGWKNLLKRLNAS